MSDIVATMKLENEQKLTASVETVKEDEKNRFSKEIEEIKQRLEEDKAQAMAEAVASIQEQLKTLKDVSYFLLHVGCAGYHSIFHLQQYNSKELELQCQLEASGQMKQKITDLENEVVSQMDL